MTEAVSDSEINLALATHFEPLALLPEWTDNVELRVLAGQSQWQSGDCGWFNSPRGCWSRFFADPPQPCDFINDPAMRDYLQEKLLEAGWIVRLVPPFMPAHNGETFMELQHQEKLMIVVQALRIRIWALAAYRALVEGK